MAAVLREHQILDLTVGNCVCHFPGKVKSGAPVLAGLGSSTFISESGNFKRNIDINKILMSLRRVKQSVDKAKTEDKHQAEYV